MKKQEFKNKRGEFKNTLGHLQKAQHPNHRDDRKRRGREKNGKLMLKK